MIRSTTIEAGAKVSVYQRHGYADRGEYLRGLAEDYGVDLDDVYAMAGAMGPTEDFDGLVSMVQDLGDGWM